MLAGTSMEVGLLYNRILGSPCTKDGVVYFLTEHFHRSRTIRRR
jgi:hypothetical protein